MRKRKRDMKKGREEEDTRINRGGRKGKEEGEKKEIGVKTEDRKKGEGRERERR